MDYKMCRYEVNMVISRSLVESRNKRGKIGIVPAEADFQKKLTNQFHLLIKRTKSTSSGTFR